jgi:polynucleotide 5'-hydroxyl-kinase GRC3/NOL9
MPNSILALTIAQAHEALVDLAPGAVALLIGATDTGKTTFALAATSALTQAGRGVALLDCDLGQSQIGPPGTVGIARVAPDRTAQIRTGRDLTLLASAFVGATTPVSHVLDTATAAWRMACAAKQSDPKPDILLVDTPGWVQGADARVFVRRLADLLEPNIILAFDRGIELSLLLNTFRGLKAPTILRVIPDPAAVRKSSTARATRRAARFAAALEGASEVTLSLDNVALCGTSLFCGEALPYHVQQSLARSLSVPVLHAEHLPGESPLIIVHGERWDTRAVSGVAEYLHSRHITIIPAQRFARLLVGLVNAQDTLLDIGLISRIDFTQRTLTIFTPCRRPAAIAQVWCGFIRVRPDGRELGTLRPGEI